MSTILGMFLMRSDTTKGNTQNNYIFLIIAVSIADVQQTTLTG